MGWDACAINKKGVVIRNHAPAFIKAANKVRTMADSVDHLLEYGALDCSACAYALEAATGANCWCNEWDAKKVKTLNQLAKWPLDADIPEEDRWAVYSAMLFLETCARRGYSIRFSW